MKPCVIFRPSGSRRLAALVRAFLLSLGCSLWQLDTLTRSKIHEIYNGSDGKGPPLSSEWCYVLRAKFSWCVVV